MKFKPEDFMTPLKPNSVRHGLEWAAEMANKRLGEMLKDAPTVYGSDDGDPDKWGTPVNWDVKNWKDKATHRAKLIEIEPIKESQTKLETKCSACEGKGYERWLDEEGSCPQCKGTGEEIEGEK